MNGAGATRLPGIVALVIFACYLIIGLCISGDFGSHWDDIAQRETGEKNVSYVFHHDKRPLRESTDRYHGPAFEILLIAAEKTLHLIDLHDIFLMRHRAVFLYMAICLVAFYFLLGRLFRDEWLPLIGCLLLITHPRIFADSFYNTKDIVAMGGMMVGMYTLVLFSARPSWFLLLLHSFISAWCIDIRLTCLMLPMATIGVMVFRNSSGAKQPVRRTAMFAAVYLLMTMCMVTLMWPILWDGPALQFSGAMKQMSRYTVWDSTSLYFGKIYRGKDTPGHYQFGWFLLTTPVLYTMFFLTGVIRLFVAMMKDKNSLSDHMFIWLSLGLFLAPPVAMWAMHSIVLDGWRHVFLIYPFFVIVVVFAIEGALGGSPLRMRAVWSVVMLSVLFNAGILCYLHPFEYSYFNPPAAVCLAPLDQKFEIDYWGPGFRQGFIYLLEKQYKGDPIKVAVSSRPGLNSYLILPESEREKIRLVEPGEADYYLSNHRWDWNPQPDDKLLYEYRRQGNRIMSIYKLH